MKESLFDLLSSRPDGASVLDLFAGSGALGIECLSRGAASVLFCDRSPAALSALEKNLRGLDGRTSVVNASFERVLKRGGEYDIIFLDPPYASGLAERALEMIADGRILAPDGLIALERAAGETYVLPKGLVLTDSRTYGGTSVDLIGYEDMRSDR